MTQWRVDVKHPFAGWTAVGWWNTKRGAKKFLRTKANPTLDFRIRKES